MAPMTELIGARVWSMALTAALVVGLCSCDMNARGAGPHTVPDGGLSVEFPAGLKVCRRMSMGYTYVGFSADLGDEPAPCNALDREPVANMAVWTESFHAQPISERLCRPDLPAPDVQARISDMLFPGRKSWTCAYRYGTAVSIYVFAEGVRPDGSLSKEYIGICSPATIGWIVTFRASGPSSPVSRSIFPLRPSPRTLTRHSAGNAGPAPVQKARP
jgi:hypothetical protein